MKLHIKHETRYQYENPVKERYSELRLKPKSIGIQNCLDFQLRLVPESQVSHYLDFYLNDVHFFDISIPHIEHEVVLEAVVELQEYQALPRPESAIIWDHLGECATNEACYDFLGTSPLVNLNVSVWRLAQDISLSRQDLWEDVESISHFVYEYLTYDQSATTVNTRVDDVIECKAGVCQDFAHVMVGICRSLNIPARYVSGYLYQGNQDIKARGTEASHAWVEAYLPNFGWRAFDPTNDRVVDDHYVTIAVGRDYSDVAPVKGTYKGVSAESMEVSVQVNETT
ncbi:MAG: transglutaminase family protein [Verrucomicrobiota bacterium]